VIIIYVSFQLDGDAQAFDSWFLPLVEQTRGAAGCVAYDYLVDPVEATRRYLFEAWSSDEALEAHHAAAEHVEMLALGTLAHGMRDLLIDRWDGLDQHRASTRRTTDEHVDGREHIDALIADVQARHHRSTGREAILERSDAP
jgi:quinol monooxygenase YgiN